jgi:hypothetical protein
MVLFLTAFMVSPPRSPATAPLASRVPPTFLIVVPDAQGLNFDLYDVR